MIQHDRMIKPVDMPEQKKKEACKEIKDVLEGFKLIYSSNKIDAGGDYYVLNFLC